MKKKMLMMLTGTLVVAMLSGCGANKSSESAYATDAMAVNGGYMQTTTAESYDYYELDGVMEMEMGSGAKMEEVTESSVTAQSTRKLITTVSMDVETKEFDTLVTTVERKTTEYGGYIESSNTYHGGQSYRGTRNAYMTIRIPKDHLEEFLGVMSDSSNVVRKNQSVEDVTLSYVDMESRKSALLIEQENLLDMLEMADSIDDMITIESRLSDVRYEIESMESQLRTYDNKIDYSTIYLSIDEVKELTPVEEKTTGEQMADGFKQSLKDIGDGFVNFAIWFVSNILKILLTLVFLSILPIVIVCNVKASRKRKAKKAALLAEKNSAPVEKHE